MVHVFLYGLLCSLAKSQLDKDLRQKLSEYSTVLVRNGYLVDAVTYFSLIQLYFDFSITVELRFDCVYNIAYIIL